MKYTLRKDLTSLIGVKTLFRIQRISNKELGGYIESEANLSQEGTSWVFENAVVFGNAKVYGNAWVSGDAWVSENAQVYEEARVYGNAQVSGNARVSGETDVADEDRLQASSQYINVSLRPYNITITQQSIVIGCKRISRFSKEKFSSLPEATKEIKAQYLPLLRELKRILPRKK